MPAPALAPHQLRLTIDPTRLGFASTAELQDLPLPWVGQERALAAAQFGLGMRQRDYHLFVLGEVGSGRRSLMRQAMQAAAAQRPVPPDLCYLHDFDAPGHPRALRLPAGAGRKLRQALAELGRSLPGDVALALSSADFKLAADAIDAEHAGHEQAAFAELQDFAARHQFQLHRATPGDDGAADERGAEFPPEADGEPADSAEFNMDDSAKPNEAADARPRPNSASAAQRRGDASGPLLFTYIGTLGRPLSADEFQQLSAEQRQQIEQAEQGLRVEIARFQGGTRPRELAHHKALQALRVRSVQPLVAQGLTPARAVLTGVPTTASNTDAAATTTTDGDAPADPAATTATTTTATPASSAPATSAAPVLQRWLAQVEAALLARLDLFEPSESDASALPDPEAEADRKDALDELLARCSVNVVVDNAGRSHAPALVEDHPSTRTLFGSIEHGSDSDLLQPDHAGVQAGSLLRAHGGFLMLHLHDLASEEGLWPRLRRFLRCGQLRIDEDGDDGAGAGPGAGPAHPEPVDVDVKLVLIGSVDEFYALQESDPDTARRFRAKVDFVDRFIATPETHRGTATMVAHCCNQRGLPHFGPEAVAELLEYSHREADDQGRQSALFTQIETLVIESATLCHARGGALVQAADVQTALRARQLRHNYPEVELHDSIVEGERLMSLTGAVTAQINAMTQIDLGDYRFGFPVRITARSFAGQEGLLNIEREVDMSGPIHDKGVLILHSYLTALFSHVAPLALNASIVFEQEYSGVEGDSASCAELYALLSSLSGLPLRQGIAVTGALNQHGEVLPVGGINEKIEGWFQTCLHAGLDGSQGVLIPARNARNLMLSRAVQDAVAQGLFSVHMAHHVSEGMALLTGAASGMEPGIEASADSVLSRAERTLRAFRAACQSAGPTAAHTRRGRAANRRLRGLD